MQIRKDRKLKVAIRDYSEYNEIFWGIESFNYSLEEENLWDVEKYWKLEYFLIKLCASLKDDEVLYRKLAADLYYLGHSINDLITNQMHPLERYILEGFNEDEAYECRDRFNHIMRMIWGRIPFRYDYLITSNPLIQKELNLTR